MNQESADNQTSSHGSAEEESFSSYGMTAGEVIAVTVLNSGISVIGTISNILVILAVLLNRQLRQTCTAIFLINLSFFDLIICTVYAPMYIYDINYGSGATFEAVRFRMGFGLFIGSLNGEFSVTLDRFISICLPYCYVAWMRKICITSVVFASWSIAISLTLLSLLTDTPLYSFFYIAVIIILIISVAMYLVSRREAKRIASQYPPECQKFPFWNKSAKAVAMVAATSLLCWVPIAILPAVVAPSSPSFKRCIKVTLAFTSLSAAVDPFIFCWRLSDFRLALCACLRKVRCMIRQKIK